MQWYKGNHKVKEGVKYTSRYNEIGNDEYEILLEINVRIAVFRNIHIQWSQNCTCTDAKTNNCTAMYHSKIFFSETTIITLYYIRTICLSF